MIQYANETRVDRATLTNPVAQSKKLRGFLTDVLEK